MKVILSLLILVCRRGVPPLRMSESIRILHAFRRTELINLLANYPLFRNYIGRDLCPTDDARVHRVAQAFTFMEDIRLSGPNSPRR